MRWVFLGAIDVPAHAKSGITERQTRSFWFDDRLPAHLTARDGDKWRTLPAECTHISNSITLSQHKNSCCQSGSVTYANTQKSANICVASHIIILILLDPGFIHAFITFVASVCMYSILRCCISIMTLVWQNISTMKDKPYSFIFIKSKWQQDYDVWGKHFFHFSITSVSSKFPDYVIIQWCT